MNRPARHNSQPAQHALHHPSTTGNNTSPPRPVRKLSTANVSVSRSRFPRMALSFSRTGLSFSRTGHPNSLARNQPSRSLRLLQSLPVLSQSLFQKDNKTKSPKTPSISKEEKNRRPVELTPPKSPCTLKLMSVLQCAHFFSTRSVHTTAPSAPRCATSSLSVCCFNPCDQLAATRSRRCLSFQEMDLNS